MIKLIAEFRIKAGQVEKTLELLKEFLSHVKDEKGTIYYKSFQKGDGRSFLNVMMFENEQAHKFHRSTNYVNKFTKFLYPLCEQEPIFTDLTEVNES